MAQKKYHFDKILKEYNKIHGYTHKLPPEAFNVMIVHTMETNVFHVTYTDEEGILKNKKKLHDFVHFHISRSITWRYIEEIILSKEKKKLNLKIEIWPPNKVRYAYLYSNYFSRDVGNLGSSCMRKKKNQRSLNFYVKNKTGIVVVIDDKNKIHARALLWGGIKSTKNKRTFTYLDRVYTNSEAICSKFSDLAKENNWVTYKGISAGNASSSLYKDNLDIKGIYHLPYTDTFKYLYYKDNIVCSNTIPSKVKHKDALLHLTTTGGEGYFPTLDPNRTQEAFTGVCISKKDAVFIKRYKDNYDGYVLQKNIISINGAYYSIADSVITKTKLDGYILKESSVGEVITGDIISKITAVFSDKYKGHIHNSNAVTIKDELYHKKDTNVICFKDKWYHSSQCFINYDRKEYNEELAKQKEWHEQYVSSCDKLSSTIAAITRKGDLIPKEHAIIAYDLAYNGTIDDIEFQEVYCTSMDGLLQLTTGEWIVSSSENRRYLKKFNNKWYIKPKFKLPDKKQLQFSFMSATRSTKEK